MAETVPVVGAGFLDALYAYAAEANDAAQVASSVGLQTLQANLREQAEQRDRWADLAGQITTFNRDGRVVVGVPGGQFASEAQTAEFGDASHPPDPLMRTSNQLADQARRAAYQHVDDVLGRVVL